MFRTSCLVCNSSNLVKIIDLGIHSFADTFIPESRLSESELIYPLSCDLCQDCGQIQTSCKTNPRDRYSLYDYSYTSSNSLFARNHWEEYAKDVSKKLKVPPGSFVIEIGSNDGFLAEQFQKQGHKVLGVDPSAYMADLAKERNVETIIDLFGRNTAKKIINQFGKAQLIIANNVFNHSDQPVDFVKAAAELMAENGTFVFESPYWLFSFKEKKFDQIYHEHINYFTVRSCSKILEQAGLKISEIELPDYHGGSLRIFAKRKKDIVEESPKIKLMINEEFSSKIFEADSYSIFMKHILAERNIFLKKMYDIKSQGRSIIAVGAAAKGNTLLSFYHLDNSVIDYVTDASPHKCGKYTPLTRIPICSDDIFAKYGEVYALILSWNISDSLKSNLYKINPKIKFLSL
jgi:SAM-dependent methyltransferase